jgi:hypothetical protein
MPGPASEVYVGGAQDAGRVRGEWSLDLIEVLLSSRSIGGWVIMMIGLIMTR